MQQQMESFDKFLKYKVLNIIILIAGILGIIFLAVCFFKFVKRMAFLAVIFVSIFILISEYEAFYKDNLLVIFSLHITYQCFFIVSFGVSMELASRSFLMKMLNIGVLFVICSYIMGLLVIIYFLRSPSIEKIFGVYHGVLGLFAVAVTIIAGLVYGKEKPPLNMVLIMQNGILLAIPVIGELLVIFSRWDFNVFIGYMILIISSLCPTSAALALIGIYKDSNNNQDGATPATAFL